MHNETITLFLLNHDLYNRYSQTPNNKIYMSRLLITNYTYSIH